MATPFRSVLVVDDSPTAVMYLSLLLKRMGFQVTPARNGAEALRLVLECPPDVILLDLRMPVMDGLTFLSRLREQGDLDPPPIIVVSVEADPGVVARCEALGAHACLQKPVGLRELHEQIQSCLEPVARKRRHLRAPFGQAVSVAALGRTRDYHAVTLSEAGIYLRMAEPLPCGTLTAVTLFLEDGRPLTLDGKVIYDKGLYGANLTVDPGVAIVFSNLTPEQSAHLSGIVRRLLVAGLFQDLVTPLVDLDRA